MVAPRSRPESGLVVNGTSATWSEAGVAPRRFTAVSEVVAVAGLFIPPSKLRTEAVVVARWFTVASEWLIVASSLRSLAPFIRGSI